MIFSRMRQTGYVPWSPISNFRRLCLHPRNPVIKKAVKNERRPAWSDKVTWVTKYLDDVFHKRMVITHRKDLCQGDYLIDDRGKNGTSKFSGEWIEFGSEKFPDWKSVLEYLI